MICCYFCLFVLSIVFSSYSPSAVWLWGVTVFCVFFFFLFGGCVRVKRDCWRSKLVKYQPDGNTPTRLDIPRKAKHGS
jgi:hypothetical protein